MVRIIPNDVKIWIFVVEHICVSHQVGAYPDASIAANIINHKKAQYKKVERGEAVNTFVKKKSLKISNCKREQKFDLKKDNWKEKKIIQKKKR